MILGYGYLDVAAKRHESDLAVFRKHLECLLDARFRLVELVFGNAGVHHEHDRGGHRSKVREASGGVAALRRLPPLTTGENATLVAT